MLSKNKRQRIYARDGYKCILCGSDEHLTIDHVIPTSKGGNNDDDNLATMCKQCNAEKANKITGLNISNVDIINDDFDYTLRFIYDE